MFPFAVVAAATGAASRSFADSRTLYVDVDRARVVRMPDGAHTIIIGNPLVADVTMLKANRLLVVTGKSFGTTNLILLDQTGAEVVEQTITVTSPADKLVVLRGTRRESYACSPDCAPAVDLADDREYTSQVVDAMKLHESAAAPGKR
ncbi:pilus assembly protein N-terminal domain-containing protein [Methylosinus sp. Sm6]|uniref:pilus assembly protein N-terminal domain-containing protein n=1 Tax=Methylosinus sp. Sm6 TaxID=2866948 RepID=UPI002106D86D|nr:pilus assembly protein N-terminal domain-containing protein [Methylosinus sp. Sm6]